MKLIVGLGNPGKKYEKTRHNLGFMIVDELARKWTKGEVEWKKSEKFSSYTLNPNPISPKDASFAYTLIVKPQTFMNGSGQAVKRLSTVYSLQSTEDIWVIHDDVDIQLGKLKIRMGGAAAGHHGVESIINELGTDKFLRFRLGIGHPHRGADAQVEKYVLREFDINEKTEVKHLIKQTIQAVEVAIKDGPEKAMNRFNR